MHVCFGLFLILRAAGFDYVATLEDDIAPGPDFLAFHVSMRPMLIAHPERILAVNAMAHGPLHDCTYVVGKCEETHDSQCLHSDMDRLFLEPYWAGWGNGVGRELFREYHYFIFRERTPSNFDEVFPASNVFGFTVNRLLQGSHAPGRVVASPCSSRVHWLANTGANGGANDDKRWDDGFTCLNWHQEGEEEGGEDGRTRRRYCEVDLPSSDELDVLVAEMSLATFDQ
jgi:hypothetical protein